MENLQGVAVLLILGPVCLVGFYVTLTQYSKVIWRCSSFTGIISGTNGHLSRTTNVP
jgi:hypothetical protein